MTPGKAGGLLGEPLKGVVEVQGRSKRHTQPQTVHSAPLRPLGSECTQRWSLHPTPPSIQSRVGWVAVFLATQHSINRGLTGACT